MSRASIYKGVMESQKRYMPQNVDMVVGKPMSSTNVICLEGNGSRPSHKGDGWIVGGAMYTLNGTEVHAVCYGVDLYNQCLTGGGV